MNNIQDPSIKFAMLIILILMAYAPATPAYDYSKWSYYDLNQAACEMAGDKNYKGALKFFDLAVQADPKNPEGYINRGAMFALTNENEKALQDERKAIQLAATDSKDDIDFRFQAHKNLSGIYLNSQQLAKAEVEARIAIQLCKFDPTALERLGDILTEQGRNAEALSYLAKAKEIYQQSALQKESAKINAKILKLQSKPHK